jgi:hypothetical protein
MERSVSGKANGSRGLNDDIEKQTHHHPLLTKYAASAPRIGRSKLGGLLVPEANGLMKQSIDNLAAGFASLTPPSSKNKDGGSSLPLVPGRRRSKLGGLLVPEANGLMKKSIDNIAAGFASLAPPSSKNKDSGSSFKQLPTSSTSVLSNNSGEKEDSIENISIPLSTSKVKRIFEVFLMET